MNIKMNNRGVSLIEITVVLVIALILLGIISLNRETQAKVAYSEEARIFINLIAEKERVFFASHNQYLDVPVSTDSVAGLGINLGKNEYYGKCTIRVSTVAPFNVFNPQMTIILTGKGKMEGATAKGVYDFSSGELKIEYNN